MANLAEIGLPPVLPSLRDEIEHYLLSPEELPIHDPINSRRWWPRIPDPSRLFALEVQPPSISLQISLCC